MRFVSDINRKSVIAWTMITIFSMVFSFIYEAFSFGVYSASMICLFVWPFVLGVIPCLFLNRDMGRFWNDGVLILMAAGMLKGIFDIYGTASMWPSVMFVLGWICILYGFVQFRSEI